MHKNTTLGVAAALVLGVTTACEPDPADIPRPDDEAPPADTGDDIAPPDDIEEDDAWEDDWNDDWNNNDDDWNVDYTDGALNVLKAAFIGEVGPYAFDDNAARVSGYHFSDDYYAYAMLDTRTDVQNGDAVMVMISVDGDLRDPRLKDGVTFNAYDNSYWEQENPLYASAIGCAGTENAWEEYDAPADEIEITVTEDADDPDVVILEYMATWQSYDGTAPNVVKGVAHIDLSN